MDSEECEKLLFSLSLKPLSTYRNLRRRKSLSSRRCTSEGYLNCGLLRQKLGEKKWKRKKPTTRTHTRAPASTAGRAPQFCQREEIALLAILHHKTDEKKSSCTTSQTQTLVAPLAVRVWVNAIYKPCVALGGGV